MDTNIYQKYEIISNQNIILQKQVLSSRTKILDLQQEIINLKKQLEKHNKDKTKTIDNNEQRTTED